MLEEIGVSSQEDLFNQIPESLKQETSLHLSEDLSEQELQDRIMELAQKNVWPGGYSSFLGGGYYDRYIPSIIENITQRVEFFTAYTPYQPEISQGTLQGIYEFQTMIANLTGMDVANASMYDGATAAAEAILMSCRIKRKYKTIVTRTVNPETQDVIRTYLNGPDIELITTGFDHNGIVDVEELAKDIDDSISCVVIQMPNFLGNIEEVKKIEQITHDAGALLVVIVDPISLGILLPPGKYGADIVVGDGQSLGCNMMYGGPAFGFMACKQKHLRQLPGRIAGASVDNKGNKAYTLTLQTREQHIRREKATSNICTNQALCALTGSIYMATLGPKGLREVANISFQRAHHLANKISAIDGFKIAYEGFFSEFVMLLPKDLSIDSFNEHMLDYKIIPGLSIGTYFDEIPNAILISVTEKNKPVDLYLYTQALKEIAKTLS